MLSASLSYHEPLTRTCRIELSYGYNTNRNKEDEQVFDSAGFPSPTGTAPSVHCLKGMKRAASTA